MIKFVVQVEVLVSVKTSEFSVMAKAPCASCKNNIKKVDKALSCVVYGNILYVIMTEIDAPSVTDSVMLCGQ